MSCECDVNLVNSIYENISNFNPSLSTSNGFNIAQNCPIKNQNKPKDKCCGTYPNRNWFLTNRSRFETQIPGLNISVWIIKKISFYQVWNQYITWMLQWPSLWHRCSIMLFRWFATTNRNMWCWRMSMCTWDLHWWPLQLLRLWCRMDWSTVQSTTLRYHVSQRRSSCIWWVWQMPLLMSNQHGRRLLPSEPMLRNKLCTRYHYDGSYRSLLVWM